MDSSLTPEGAMIRFRLVRAGGTDGLSGSISSRIVSKSKSEARSQLGRVRITKGRE